VSRFDICQGVSPLLPHDQTTSIDKENEGCQEHRDQIQQLEDGTSSPKKDYQQPSVKYVYSGSSMNVSELEITTENEAKERWINFSDITKMLTDSSKVSFEEHSDDTSVVDSTMESSVYLVEVTDDSTLLTPLECTSIIDQALTLSNITQQDQLSASSYQDDAGEQCCPSADDSSDIHECCQGLLALQNQQVPDSPPQNGIHHTNLNTTVSPYGYKNMSSLESSPVISQRKNSDHLVDSPRLTELLQSPVVVVPQDVYHTEHHRIPDITGMSPFIVPSSPDVSNILRGISNPIATEEFSQSSNSQENNACTPCGVVSEDPLNYVSPFTTPRLGFSPTFAELSPGRIVLDNECCQQESPIQRAAVCSVTDFTEIGLTSVAASVEICSSSDEHKVTRTKRTYRKRQPKDSAHDAHIDQKKPRKYQPKTAGYFNKKEQNGSESEAYIPQKKQRKYQPKTHRDTGTKKTAKTSNKTPKSCKKQTTQDTNHTDMPTEVLQQERNSFKTPSPRVRMGTLKRMATQEPNPTDVPTKVLPQELNSFKTPSPRVRIGPGKLKGMATPETSVPRKQIKAKKEPKQKKTVCKRQLINS